MGEANSSSVDDDLLLKNFFAEVSEVERDNEVARILSCFKLNAFEYLNLPFDSSIEDVKKQYRKLSLLVHPGKCKHPQAKEAFGALAKAQQLLLDSQEREYLLNQVNSARAELRAKRKKQLKKDTASKLKSQVDEGKYEQEYEKSEEFQNQLKMKVQELLTDPEWRRRKMQMRISEEEGRLKKDEEETKDIWKRKREHEEQWEGTREKRAPLPAVQTQAAHEDEEEEEQAAEPEEEEKEEQAVEPEEEEEEITPVAPEVQAPQAPMELIPQALITEAGPSRPSRVDRLWRRVDSIEQEMRDREDNETYLRRKTEIYLSLAHRWQHASQRVTSNYRRVIDIATRELERLRESVGPGPLQDQIEAVINRLDDGFDAAWNYEREALDWARKGAL